MSTRIALNPIDFSDGIRDDELNEHFDSVDEQFKRERLYVAGSGVMSGLNFSTLKFKLYVSEGSVVDLEGSEVFFDDMSFDIEPPKLISKTETLKADSNGMITLQYIPYATTRWTPSEFDMVNSGITAVDADNVTRVIKPLSISGNVLKFDARVNANKNITVSYKYAFRRYDLIYIDNNYEVKILQGLSSSSPSVPMPKSTVVNGTTIQGYRYILGYILIDPFYANMQSTVPADRNAHANILVTKEYKNLRNIYTDESNNLYICGTPFKDLQIIHMDRPSEPVKENTLWYDTTYNKLRIYRTVDGISDWHVMNDMSVIPVMEYLIWTHEELDTASKLPIPYRHDLQTFKFSDKGEQDTLRMKFVPGKNELEVIIDNVPLMHDQFSEIVSEDPDGMYENLGIGFKLVEPLDHAADIEVRVTHRVWEDPVYVRFQRSATFVAADSFDYLAQNGLDITTNVPYQYLENQLEVYVDGIRMEIGKDYYEGTDLSDDDKVKGKMSKQFTFTSLVPTVKRISYKITTSVYSYDHLNDLIGDLGTRIAMVENEMTMTTDNMMQFQNTVSNQINTMQSTVNAISQNSAQLSSYVKKTDVLAMSNMPTQITSWTPSAIINKTVTYSASSGSLNISLAPSGASGMFTFMTDNISPQDYIQVFDISTAGGNRILRRKDGTGSVYDYDIITISGVTYLSLANNTIVQDGHTLYITGLKLGGV
jgi:hypothetical protein